MAITRETVAQKLAAYLHHEISLADLVDWAQKEFLPQLMITFVPYSGTTEDEKTPQGARFMDSRRFEGPIPAMIRQAETYVL